MFTTSRSTIVLLVFGTAILVAAGPPPALKDAFLDNLVGDWSVTRKMSNGRTIESTVRGEWVLKHQFIQLHYGAGEKGREYEALVFIGFDDAAKSYVCHWVDIFGATTLESVTGSLIRSCSASNFGSIPRRAR